MFYVCLDDDFLDFDFDLVLSLCVCMVLIFCARASRFFRNRKFFSCVRT